MYQRMYQKIKFNCKINCCNFRSIINFILQINCYKSIVKTKSRWTIFVVVTFSNSNSIVCNSNVGVLMWYRYIWPAQLEHIHTESTLSIFTSSNTWLYIKSMRNDNWYMNLNLNMSHISHIWVIWEVETVYGVTLY